MRFVNIYRYDGSFKEFFDCVAIDDSMSEEEMLRDLVEHDGYPTDIFIEKGYKGECGNYYIDEIVYSNKPCDVKEMNEHFELYGSYAKYDLF